MTLQAVGQSLVVIGFIGWVAAWVGLGVVGMVSASRHRAAPAVCAVLLSIGLASVGIAALALLPGRLNELP